MYVYNKKNNLFSDFSKKKKESFDPFSYYIVF